MEQEFNAQNFEFAHAVVNAIEKISSLLTSDPEESLSAIEDFLQSDDGHMNTWKNDVIAWKDEPEQAARSLAEILVYQRLLHDLQDMVGVSECMNDVKDAIYATRTTVAAQDGGADFFNAAHKMLNDHIDNSSTFIGHKWKELHLDLIAQNETSNVAVEEEKPHSSTELSMRARIYAEGNDLA